jgi:hypothetical protein
MRLTIDAAIKVMLEGKMIVKKAKIEMQLYSSADSTTMRTTNNSGTRPGDTGSTRNAALRLSTSQMRKIIRAVTVIYGWYN